MILLDVIFRFKVESGGQYAVRWFGADTPEFKQSLVKNSKTKYVIHLYCSWQMQGYYTSELEPGKKESLYILKNYLGSKKKKSKKLAGGS